MFYSKATETIILLYTSFTLLSVSADEYLHYRAMLKVCCMRMMDTPLATGTKSSSVCVNSLCTLADSTAGSVRVCFDQL